MDGLTAAVGRLQASPARDVQRLVGEIDDAFDGVERGLPLAVEMHDWLYLMATLGDAGQRAGRMARRSSSEACAGIVRGIEFAARGGKTL